jgi:hypothetical protein
MKTEKIKLSCPLDCSDKIIATLSPGRPATRLDPAEAAEIEELDGPCLHVKLYNEGNLTASDLTVMEEAVWIAETEAWLNAKDAAEQSRIDLLREEG